MVLKEKELQEITGGAVKAGILITIAGVLTFIIGVVDGYLRPLTCNR